MCRVKYNNTLPDIPFDPKFITYPFESNRSALISKEIALLVKVLLRLIIIVTLNWKIIDLYQINMAFDYYE